MLRNRVLGSLPRPLQVSLLALALISLLGGCFPPPITTNGGTAAATTAEPAATVSAGGGETTTPLGTAVSATTPPTGTTAPATAETPASSTTPAANETPIPTDLAAGIVVQKADKSVQVVDNTGNALPLYQAENTVDMTSIFPPGNAVSNTLYLPLNGNPAAIVKLNAFGGQPIASVNGQVYGLAVSPQQLAFGSADLGPGSTTARINVAGLEGTDATTVYSETVSTAPHVLRVFRWTPDGKRLYFGKEPVGLGGYILFGGLTNLWTLDPGSGQATELVHERAPNAAICIDDLSPDGSTAADHCTPKTMELIDVATQVTRTVALPAEVQDFGAVGGARFSPDGKRLAFALARQNPDNEQGWVAVADVAGGPSRLIATSPANDYFSVVAFRNDGTLLLQSAGQTPGVWSVDEDGQNLKRITDGVFLGILGSQP